MTGTSGRSKPILAVEDLTKRYGDEPALAGVSLSVSEGEVFGLLGPNGAGKTTLMQVIATLTEPTDGRVLVDGLDVRTEPDAVRSRLGYVPQHTALDHYLTGRQVLELFAGLYRLPPGETDRRVERALERVDLADHADDLVEGYSGGMKRRLELATGLLHEPTLLVFDEPTLGLDPSMRRETWEYVRDLRDAGVTVLLSTHYLEEAETLADRVAVLRDGSVRAIDSPSALRRDGDGATFDEVFEELTAVETGVMT